MGVVPKLFGAFFFFCYQIFLTSRSYVTEKPVRTHLIIIRYQKIGTLPIDPFLPTELIILKGYII